jgi:Tol biopolymer transport system component
MVPKLRPATLFLSALMIWQDVSGGALAEEKSHFVGSPSEGLVFVREREEGSELWRARLSDGAVMQLTETDDVAERRPKWSQAAERLAYLGQLERGGLKRMQIQLLDFDSKEGSDLGAKPELVQLRPVWAPDGKRIAYSFSISPKPENIRAGVVSIDVDGGNRRVVVDGGALDVGISQLAFSPDGTSLVMTTTHKKTRGTQIWVSQAGGKARRMIAFANNDYSFPQFTRDGKQLVFAAKPSSLDERDIMLTALPMTRKQQLKTLSKSEGSDDYYPIPSPTRDEIAFISNRDGNYDLFLIKTAGGVAINLTRNSTDDDISPVWSPDGEMIAYRVRRMDPGSGEPVGTSLVRVVGRNGKAIFETEGAMPDWMPPWPGDAKQPASPGKSEKSE